MDIDLNKGKEKDLTMKVRQKVTAHTPKKTMKWRLTDNFVTPQAIMEFIPRRISV